jgi:hypothetical protein
MIRHYRGCGVRSFFIHIQAHAADDEHVERIREVLAAEAVKEASVTVGSWQRHQQELYECSRRCYPHDWFILADHDELHEYPEPVTEIVSRADHAGATHVSGLLVDRLSADGGLPAVADDEPLDTQFPLGSFVSFSLLGAVPSKVVLVKGAIKVSPGQHGAPHSQGLEGGRWMVPVQHFKWIADLPQRLRQRVPELREDGRGHYMESVRCLRHLEAHHDRIDISNPRFLVAPARPTWFFWPFALSWLNQLPRHKPR